MTDRSAAGDTTKVSVVICTYSLDLYEHLKEAVESVRSQSYDPVETVVVVDGNEDLCDRVHGDYGDLDDVVIHCNDANYGLSVSRNNGFEAATGDVVAFMDDDAVADPDWVAELVETYESEDAVAVGGPMEPLWVAGRPTFLPEEFYWLIGVTHEGAADPGEEVRNTNGSNMSFRREVLEELDGFDPEVGRKGDANLQAEESEFGARLQAEYGRGVVYDPDAVVSHKVFDYRTGKRWLAGRAFWQGYSKRAMWTIAPAAGGDEESDFLGMLLFESTPKRIAGLLRGPSVEKATQLLTLWVLTAIVGLGYCYGFLKYPPWAGD